MLFRCSEEYFYKSLLSGKFYRFLQTGRRDVDLSCVLHNIHCMPDEEIIFCSVFIYFLQNLKYLYFQSNVIDVFFGVRSAGDCQLSCFYHHRSALSLTTNQEGRSPQTRIFQRLCNLHLVWQLSPNLPSVMFPLLQVRKLKSLSELNIEPSLSAGAAKLWRWITLSQVRDSNIASRARCCRSLLPPGPPSCVCGKKMACKGANHNHVGFQVCNLW